MSLVIIYSGIRIGESRAWEITGSKAALTRLMGTIYGRTRRTYLTLLDDNGKVIDRLG